MSVMFTKEWIEDERRVLENDPFPGVDKDFYLDALSEIERLQAENEKLRDKVRWIPVSQLPDVKQDTLFICAIKLDGGKWKVDARTYWAGAQLFNGIGVEYYQPLPLPPEVLK